MENFNESVLYDIVKEFISDFSEEKKNEDLTGLGMTSIQIMDIANRLKKYGIRIPVHKLGEAPVFEKWLDLVKTHSGFENVKVSGNRKESLSSEFPLTEIQKSYWFGRNLKKNLGNVSCHVYLELDGKGVEPDRLADAWKKIFEYHPMMRMKITPSGNQCIMEKSAFDKLDVFDLRNLSDSEAESRLQTVRDERSARKLKIDEGETAGLALALLPENRTRICFDLDLIAADVMSFYIIMNDLCKLYTGNEPDVPADWSLAEYAASQEEALKNDIAEAEAFWKKKTLTMPGRPELPVNESALENGNCSYRRKLVKIEKSKWDKFEKVCAANKATPAMALLTVYASAIERWSADNRFLINIPVFNRDTCTEGIEKVVADFTNLLIVDTECRVSDTFAERVKRTAGTFRENLSYSAYSGIKVQKLLRDLHHDSSAPVAPVVYSYTIGQKLLDRNCLDVFGELGFMISQTPQVYIDFQIVEAGDTVIFSFDSPVELFENEVIDGIFDDMKRLFDRVTERNGDWSFILWDDESSCIPQGYALPENSRLLHEGMLEYALKNPEKTALVSAADGKSMTFGELRSEALKTAAMLIENGVKPGDAVSFTLPRGFEQVIAVYGILCAGGHYVPVGAHLPFARRTKIYGRCKVGFVLTDEKYSKGLEFPDEMKVMNISSRSEYSEAKPYSYPDNTSVAYIILTSGTTGEPKGVVITHYNAVNTLDTVNREYSINETDTALAVSAVDFDLSVYDMFGIPGAGGTLVILDDHTAKDNMVWLKAVEKYNVTVWNSVPVLMEMLLMGAESLKKSPLPLKTVMLSGDWISPDLPEKINRNAKNCSIAAMGGATEGAVWSNLYKVTLPLRDGWTSVPYGYPLDGQLYRVVDRQGRDCRPYVRGELWIGGCGVAAGYAGDPETTAAKFTEYQGLRWYRTGDYGRYREENIIEFLGREDAQIKLNGYRVELGEIESMMNEIPEITSSAAVFDKKHEKIAAFYTGAKLEDKAVLDVIRTEVPEYMLPSVIIRLDEMPVTRNSKIDRKQLVKLAEEANEAVTLSDSESEGTETEFTAFLKELFGTKTLAMNSGFIANNGDSIQAMKLATWLNEKMNVEIDAFDILNADALTEIEDEINEQLSSGKFTV